MSERSGRSIVIPVFNEATILRETTMDILAACTERGQAFEIILAENGSTDGSRDICDELAAELEPIKAMHLRDPNYGLALRAGILAAEFDTIVNFSIDWWDIEFVERASGLLTETDFVIGSKSEDPASDTRSFVRKYGSAAFHVLERVIFPMPVRDTHGLKVLKRAAVQPIAEMCLFGSEVFETELAVRCLKAGVRISEITIAIEEVRPGRINIFKRAVRAFWHLIELRLRIWLDRRPVRRAER